MRTTADRMVIGICALLVLACLVWFFVDLYAFTWDSATCEAQGGAYVDETCIDRDAVIVMEDA